jgi:tagatose 6-phosphate kinase
MILCVTLNPALDITHHVPGADWAGVNRPDQVRDRPGGKGLNVARVLRALGADVLVLGLAGGAAGDEVRAGLEAAGVPSRFTPIAGATRRTFTVVDRVRGQAASFHEPGPAVEAGEWAAFTVTLEKCLAGCAAAVFSGSLPAGVPDDAYADLTGRAAAAGVPVLLDTHGEALVRGAAAGPAIVKPNLAELEAATGLELSLPDGSADHQAVARAARRLRGAGPEAVVVTLGPAGLWASTRTRTWRAVPPAPVAGNPVGAGDAVAAGLIHGLVTGRPWEERLRHAVALGSAAVAAPAAGEFRPDDYAAALGGVAVTQVADG